MNMHIDDISTNSRVVNNSKDLLVWVPSSDVVVHAVPIPKAPKRKWLDLIPWILEDKLLSSPEESHFVIAAKESDKLKVIVVAKSQMTQWIEKVNTAGITDYQLLPDFLALSWRPGLISVGKRQDKILIRFGEVEGFAASADVAWFMLERLLQNAEFSDKEANLSLSMPEEELPEKYHGKIANRFAAINWQRDDLNSAANLLVNNFAKPLELSLSKAWLSTVALLFVTLLLAFISLSINNSSLSSEIEGLEQQNRSDFYDFFPGLTIRSGDIRTTLENYVSDRFKQRESLNSDIVLSLITADQALSSCSCELQKITWSNNSLELSLPLSAREKAEQMNFEGYSKQVRPSVDGFFTLSLRKESM